MSETREKKYMRTGTIVALGAIFFGTIFYFILTAIGAIELSPEFVKFLKTSITEMSRYEFYATVGLLILIFGNRS